MVKASARATIFCAGLAAAAMTSLGSFGSTGGVARAAPTMTTTTPYPGVTHTVYSDAVTPLVVHVVTVDATSQEIHFAATAAGDRGQTVGDWADCAHGTSNGCTPSDVVINGDLFVPSGFVPSGLAIGGAQTWPDAATPRGEGYLAIGRPMDVNALELAAPGTTALPDSSLAAEDAVGGGVLLVESSMALGSFDADAPTDPYRAAPRTAVAVDAGKRTLWLIVVDGDQPSSAGMTDAQLADFIVSLGASDALELDGGGSSTMYIRKEGGVVNSPSDGVQRPVANQLGLHFGASPYHFSVVGEIFDTTFGDTSKYITTASVVVDGQTATWQNSHTLYHVDDIAPHYVCAHATAPGYKSGTQCRQIDEVDVAPPNGNAIQYLSLVLFPGKDPPPDMSPPDDLAHQAPPPPVRDLAAATTPRDMSGGKVTTGGCNVSDGEVRSPISFLLLIVLFLGATKTCRRRRS
jgi:hypothetical protein